MPQVLKNKRFIVLASIILFLIIGSFCFWNFNLKDSKVDAAGESWLTGWTYRKSITVTNNIPACTVSSGLTCAVTTSDEYVINTFTGSGTWTVPAGITSVDYLVVAGGGGGGGAGGGGGGAGGLKTATNFTVVPGASPTVTVGAGGGVTTNGQGTSGLDSVFSSITATGGGGGASGYTITGINGGSGGGGSAYGGTPGSGTSGQGNSGGAGAASPGLYGGGGGGAGATGQAGTASVGGAGGAGYTSLISGSSIVYAGGGGGFSGGTATGGGGAGNGLAGTNGLGGGGGGAGGGASGGVGGSGTVIIRYLAPTLTNYQTKITVPYVSGMKTDFSDLRFTSSDGTTEFSYWIESYTASTSAVVWVKITSLVPGSNTIYMYYGNSSATAASDGDNTFVFFDDFAGTTFDVTKWDTLNSPTVSGGYAAFRSTTAWQAALSKYTASDTRNYQIYVRYRIVDTSEQRLFHGWSNVTDPSSNYPACSYMYGYNRLYATYGGTSYVSFAFSLGTWYTAKHNLNSSYYQTVTLVENGSATVTATTAYNSTINKVFLGTVYGGGDVDWVFVKSYAPTEPTVVIGGEEIAGCGTGGTVTKVDSYCIHSFTTVGATTWMVPTGVTTVDYLVVGGGGAGSGGTAGGGGGAGAFRTGTGFSVSGTLNVTVGAGGIGSTTTGTAGSDSSFSSVTAVGGGYGASSSSAAVAGGSGGGGSYWYVNAGGTSGGGYAGGAGLHTDPPAPAGGGGGCGSAGNPGATSGGGAGGVGCASSITGISVYYAGGGGGGAQATGAGAGGNGGGGAGSYNSTGTNGTNNLGGGGGGGGYSVGAKSGGNGGSGIVIVRYLATDAPAVLTEVTPVSSPTTNTTPSYTFSSIKAGTITYGGGCSSSTTSAVAGNNTITFNTLAAGTHSCTIAINDSNVLTATFTVVSFATYTSPNLSCTLTNGSCTGTNEAIIFKIYDPAGNHAELSTQSNYSYKVCCTGTGISNSCSGNYDTVLKLSAATNAHAEKKTLSNYTNNVCLSSSTMGATCGYSANTSCSDLGTNYVCLASISGDTNAHVGECSTYSTKVCCRIIVLVDACTAKVSSSKPITSKDVDIQLCSGADVTNTSDPCYSVCWKGTGTPDLTSSDWKCGVCHDISNSPVSCSSTAASATFTWGMPSGYIENTNYTLIDDTTLASANPIIRFAAQDSNRIVTLGINSMGVSCSGQNSIQLTPTWREISPF